MRRNRSVLMASTVVAVWAAVTLVSVVARAEAQDDSHRTWHVGASAAPGGDGSA
jgi:hypothetical protein